MHENGVGGRVGAHCLAADTPALLADGSTRPIGALRPGDRVFGTRDGRYSPTVVVARSTAARPAYRVSLAGGTQVVSGAGNRLRTDLGWRALTPGGERLHLTRGTRVQGTGRFAAPPERNRDYRLGYLWGAVRGGPPVAPEVLARVREFAGGGEPRERDLVEWPTQLGDDWAKGFLAGVFDVRGAAVGGQVVLSSPDSAVFEAVVVALLRLRVPHSVEVRGVRVTGAPAERLRFLHLVGPVLARPAVLEGVQVGGAPALGVVSVESLGIEVEMGAVTTESGDLVVNGLIACADGR